MTQSLSYFTNISSILDVSPCEYKKSIFPQVALAGKSRYKPLDRMLTGTTAVQENMQSNSNRYVSKISLVPLSFWVCQDFVLNVRNSWKDDSHSFNTQKYRFWHNLSYSIKFYEMSTKTCYLTSFITPTGMSFIKLYIIRQSVSGFSTPNWQNINRKAAFYLGCEM